MTDVLSALGLSRETSGLFAGDTLPAHGEPIVSVDPSTGAPLGTVVGASAADYDAAVDVAARAFHDWRLVPAPVRGQAVRAIAAALRANKAPLAALLAREVGKIRSEAEGEIQEMIDVADFAVGLSRQLCGSTMHS